MSHPDLTRLVDKPPGAAVALARITDPAILVAGVLAVVCWESSDPWSALGWTLLTSLFCVGIPLAVLHAMVGRGLVQDRHLVMREQRRAPLAAALLSVLVGVLALQVLGAPVAVTALVLAMLAGLLLMTGMSLVYKASFHLAVAAGVIGILGALYGWGVYVPGVILVLAVSWARVSTGRHTVAQTGIGALVGWAAAVVVFGALT